MGDRAVSRVVVATMRPRERGEAREETPAKRSSRFRLPRHLPALVAAACCVGAGVYAVARPGGPASEAMSRLTAGFEYDETLGRLQFVSNILPESAMVFLSGGDAQPEMTQPTSAQLTHAWDEREPWLEYACTGDVVACEDGEVMTVVRNREDEYTVRVLHENGYESIYSGLTQVDLRESDPVKAGQRVGSASGLAAFELRCNGLSVQPAFAAL